MATKVISGGKNEQKIPLINDQITNKNDKAPAKGGWCSWLRPSSNKSKPVIGSSVSGTELSIQNKPMKHSVVDTVHGRDSTINYVKSDKSTSESAVKYGGIATGLVSFANSAASTAGYIGTTIGAYGSDMGPVTTTTGHGAGLVGTLFQYGKELIGLGKARQDKSDPEKVAAQSPNKTDANREMHSETVAKTGALIRGGKYMTSLVSNVAKGASFKDASGVATKSAAKPAVNAASHTVGALGFAGAAVNDVNKYHKAKQASSHAQQKLEERDGANQKKSDHDQALNAIGMQVKNTADLRKKDAIIGSVSDVTAAVGSGVAASTTPGKPENFIASGVVSVFASAKSNVTKSLNIYRQWKADRAKFQHRAVRFDKKDVNDSGGKTFNEIVANGNKAVNRALTNSGMGAVGQATYGNTLFGKSGLKDLVQRYNNSLDAPDQGQNKNNDGLSKSPKSSQKLKDVNKKQSNYGSTSNVTLEETNKKVKKDNLENKMDIEEEPYSELGDGLDLDQGYEMMDGKIYKLTDDNKNISKNREDKDPLGLLGQDDKSSQFHNNPSRLHNNPKSPTKPLPLPSGKPNLIQEVLSDDDPTVSGDFNPKYTPEQLDALEKFAFTEALKTDRETALNYLFDKFVEEESASKNDIELGNQSPPSTIRQFLKDFGNMTDEQLDKLSKTALDATGIQNIANKSDRIAKRREVMQAMGSHLGVMD